MTELVGQIGLVLGVCVAFGALALVLRLPLLVGLLVAGVIVGPEVLGLVEATEEIELLGEIGISLLLFVVGLKLDPRLVRELGPVVLLAGTIQVLVTAALAFGIASLFGTGMVASLYLAMGMAFSSTVVVIKVLTDRGQIEQLHGRIALGILIVQDIVVIGLMVVLSSVGAGEGATALGQFAGVGLRGALLFGGVALLSRFVLPRAIHILARQGELLVLASVTWAVALAAVSIVLGFSAEVGAFIAGVALASSDYREAISGRLSTLRDFLLVFFFIDLGTHLTFEGTADLGLIAALCVFVLVAKPILIALITTILGFHQRVAVRAGLTLAQISEFSLILAALGVALGHIDGQTAGVITAVALVTITASTLLSDRSNRLAPTLARPLQRLERARTRSETRRAAGIEPAVIVIGVGRLGRTLMEELRNLGDDVLAVDFDPTTQTRQTLPAPVVFGDAMDPELPGQLPMRKVRWVISTLRDPEAHRTLIEALRRHGYEGAVAVAANDADDEPMLRGLGVALVVTPLHLAAKPLLEIVHAHARRPADVPRTLG